MAADRRHHKSKKNRYTMILVPDEDATKAKNFQVAPWQLVAGLMLFAAFAVAIVLLTIIYTPVGLVFPLTNPELENRYSRELVSLNQRMTGLMEQLMDLRTYNIKLRRALGENVVVTDSGGIKTVLPQTEAGSYRTRLDESTGSKILPRMGSEQRMLAARSVTSEAQVPIGISFPAIMPTEGYVTRGFEPEHNHYGLDIAGKTGTLIVAAADGNIVFSGWTYDDGYIVILSHTSGFMTFYKHNQTLLKSLGAFVRRGDPIATLGNSGITSLGPHLHFEVWKDGVPVDPSAYMINFYL